MKKNTNIILLFSIPFLCIYSASASAQDAVTNGSRIYNNVLDSIKQSLHRQRGLNFDFDSRYSFIGSGVGDIIGVKLGVEFGDKFEVGLSGHLLDEVNAHFYKNYPVLHFGNTIETVKAHLQLFYMAAYAEYVFYRDAQWKFSVPVQLGMGESNYLYTYNGIEKVNNLHAIILLEPIISSEYSLNSWFSLTAQFGLRLMLLNNPAVEDNLNSPTFSLGFSITYTQACKTLFPNSQLTNWLNKI
jgi:hypothetical protein